MVINIGLADVYQMEPGIESMGRSITSTLRDHRAPFSGPWRPSEPTTGQDSRPVSKDTVSGMVLDGDEAVESGGGVVDGAGHRAKSRTA